MVLYHFFFFMKCPSICNQLTACARPAPGPGESGNQSSMADMARANLFRLPCGEDQDQSDGLVFGETWGRSGRFDGLDPGCGASQGETWGEGGE